MKKLLQNYFEKNKKGSLDPRRIYAWQDIFSGRETQKEVTQKLAETDEHPDDAVDTPEYRYQRLKDLRNNIYQSTQDRLNQNQKNQLWNRIGQLLRDQILQESRGDMPSLYTYSDGAMSKDPKKLNTEEFEHYFRDMHQSIRGIVLQEKAMGIFSSSPEEKTKSPSFNAKQESGKEEQVQLQNLKEEKEQRDIASWNVAKYFGIPDNQVYKFQEISQIFFEKFGMNFPQAFEGYQNYLEGPLAVLKDTEKYGHFYENIKGVIRQRMYDSVKEMDRITEKFEGDYTNKQWIVNERIIDGLQDVSDLLRTAQFYVDKTENPEYRPTVSPESKKHFRTTTSLYLRDETGKKVLFNVLQAAEKKESLPPQMASILDREGEVWLGYDKTTGVSKLDAKEKNIHIRRIQTEPYLEIRVYDAQMKLDDHVEERMKRIENNFVKRSVDFDGYRDFGQNFGYFLGDENPHIQEGLMAPRLDKILLESGPVGDESLVKKMEKLEVTFLNEEDQAIEAKAMIGYMAAIVPQLFSDVVGVFVDLPDLFSTEDMNLWWSKNLPGLGSLIDENYEMDKRWYDHVAAGVGIVGAVVTFGQLGSEMSKSVKLAKAVKKLSYLPDSAILKALEDINPKYRKQAGLFCKKIRELNKLGETKEVSKSAKQVDHIEDTQAFRKWADIEDTETILETRKGEKEGFMDFVIKKEDGSVYIKRVQEDRLGAPVKVPDMQGAQVAEKVRKVTENNRPFIGQLTEGERAFFGISPDENVITATKKIQQKLLDMGYGVRHDGQRIVDGDIGSDMAKSKTQESLDAWRKERTGAGDVSKNFGLASKPMTDEQRRVMDMPFEARKGLAEEIFKKHGIELTDADWAEIGKAHDHGAETIYLNKFGDPEYPVEVRLEKRDMILNALAKNHPEMTPRQQKDLANNLLDKRVAGGDLAPDVVKAHIESNPAFLDKVVTKKPEMIVQYPEVFEALVFTEKQQKTLFLTLANKPEVVAQMHPEKLFESIKDFVATKNPENIKKSFANALLSHKGEIPNLQEWKILFGDIKLKTGKNFIESVFEKILQNPKGTDVIIKNKNIFDDILNSEKGKPFWNKMSYGNGPGQNEMAQSFGMTMPEWMHRVKYEQGKITRDEYDAFLKKDLPPASSSVSETVSKGAPESKASEVTNPPKKTTEENVDVINQKRAEAEKGISGEPSQKLSSGKTKAQLLQSFRELRGDFEQKDAFIGQYLTENPRFIAQNFEKFKPRIKANPALQENLIKSVLDGDIVIAGRIDGNVYNAGNASKIDYDLITDMDEVYYGLQKAVSRSLESSANKTELWDHLYKNELNIRLLQSNGGEEIQTIENKLMDKFPEETDLLHDFFNASGGYKTARKEWEVLQTDIAHRLSRAEDSLGRVLDSDQQKAVIEAHNIGSGREGAGIGTYNNSEIWQKARILKKAGFSEEERRILLTQGICGTEIPTPKGMDISSMVTGVSRAEHNNLIRSKAIEDLSDKTGLSYAQISDAYEVIERNQNLVDPQKMAYLLKGTEAEAMNVFRTMSPKIAGAVVGEVLSFNPSRYAEFAGEYARQGDMEKASTMLRSLISLNPSAGRIYISEFVSSGQKSLAKKMLNSLVFKDKEEGIDVVADLIKKGNVDVCTSALEDIIKSGHPKSFDLLKMAHQSTLSRTVFGKLATLFAKTARDLKNTKETHRLEEFMVDMIVHDTRFTKGANLDTGYRPPSEVMDMAVEMDRGGDSVREMVESLIYNANEKLIKSASGKEIK